MNIRAQISLALYPCTRLVHFITFPTTYPWRPYQVVIWNSPNARILERR